MKHELTHEELLDIKALKERRKVSTADVPMINAIYSRMTPGYSICPTCIETLGAEAKSLIAYAEKQIGGSILNYTGTEEESAEIESSEKIVKKPVQDDMKEVKVERLHFGMKALVTLRVPAELTQEGIDKIGDIDEHFNQAAIVAVEYANSVPVTFTPEEIRDVTEKGSTTKEITLPATLKEKNVGLKFTAVQIQELPTPELIAYVEKETDIELSEHASREELVADALDLLGLNAAAPASDKVVLHKNGLTASKGDIIYAYVKQETGTDLPKGLKRPALLIAAAEALKNAE